jgi:hypothetical protein
VIKLDVLGFPDMGWVVWGSEETSIVLFMWGVFYNNPFSSENKALKGRKIEKC